MPRITPQHLALCLFFFFFSFFQLGAQIPFSSVIIPSQDILHQSYFCISAITLLDIVFWGIGIFPLVIILILIILLFVFWINYKSISTEVNELKLEVVNLTRKNSVKDKFFSIIAHDLKSPFNSLMGLSEMLVLHSETMNQSEVINYSKMVHQSTVKLFALVENLLQWSRTQMGTSEFKPEKLDLNILTGNVVNLLRLSAQEKDIVIALKMTPDLLSYADANIYSTVLRNIVGNAIKFSRVGSIIHVLGRKRADGMIEIEVTDSGVGMNSDQLEKVFNLETAHSTVGTLNERGTGLGLILSKEFVELNRGVININSRMGEGTTVTFTVPSMMLTAN